MSRSRSRGAVQEILSMLSSSQPGASLSASLKLAPGWEEDSIERISCTAPRERARDMGEEDNQTELHVSLEKGTSLFQEPRGLAAGASLLIPVSTRTQLFVFHCLSERVKQLQEQPQRTRGYREREREREEALHSDEASVSIPLWPWWKSEEVADRPTLLQRSLKCHPSCKGRVVVRGSSTGFQSPIT
ncbi:unnamed protein product [Arctogadus glacialis]